MKNVIPCLFTSGNLSFGVLSMIMTLHGLYTWAGVCILLAMVCDACDGRSARALGVAGDFGKELDSLSDVVSFGAASAFLIYSYSLQSLGWIGAIPAIIYAALGGIRLARFNLNTGVIHGYFQGMPIPNGGCLIATYVISGAVLHMAAGHLRRPPGLPSGQQGPQPRFQRGQPGRAPQIGPGHFPHLRRFGPGLRRLPSDHHHAFLTVYRLRVSQYGHERRSCSLSL